MVYKNLLIRSITSICLIMLLLCLIFFYENSIKYLSILIYLIVFAEILYFFKEKKIFILIYLFFSAFFFHVFLFLVYDQLILLLTISIIILFDTFSYIFGSLLGKKKIIPSISPNKTYVGFILGFLVTLLIINLVIIFANLPLIKVNIYIVLIILIAFIGDLIESFFKRKSEIKNSSNFLPGHGGFFDRFDSFILVSFILPFSNYIL